MFIVILANEFRYGMSWHISLLMKQILAKFKIIIITFIIQVFVL